MTALATSRASLLNAPFRLGLLACAWALLAAGPGLGQNWPSFRGPGASGVTEGPELPRDWDLATGRNLRWKLPIPGLGHSSPVVWQDKVFLTTAVSSATELEFLHGLSGDMRPAKDLSSQSWHLLCIDKKSGQLLWDRTLREGVPHEPRHPKNSFATPTVATDGKVVIAYLGSEGLYAFDLEGKPLWQKDLGVQRAGFAKNPEFQWGVGSSPILYRDRVVLQCDGNDQSYLAAFDAQDGHPVWRTERGEQPSWSTPTVVAGPDFDQLVTVAPGSVRGYRAATGEELWRLRWDMLIVESTPVTASGLVYVSSGKGSRHPILAVKPTARGDITLPEGQTQSDAVAWSTQKGGPITTSVLVYGEYLYAMEDQGFLRCFRAKTGELLYEQRIPKDFLSSPVASGGKVYLAADDGEVLVIQAGPSYELLATNQLPEAIVATPAISDGLLLVRTVAGLYAFGNTPPPPAPATAAK